MLLHRGLEEITAYSNVIFAHLLTKMQIDKLREVLKVFLFFIESFFELMQCFL
jgi:hypothetical protein